MASPNLKQKVILEGQKALTKAFSQSKLKKAGIAVAKEMQKIWFDRCASGLDVNNKRLAGFTKSYTKFKRDYIRGKRRIKGARGRTTSRKAGNLPNHIRLTGQLQSGTKFKPLTTTQKLDPDVGRLVFGGVQVNVPSQFNKNKFKWLASGRGRSRKGSYSKAKRQVDPTLSRNITQQNKDKKRLTNIFKNNLGLDKVRARIA